MKKPKNEETLEDVILDQMRLLQRLQRIAGLPTSEMLRRLAKVWREGGDADLMVLSHKLIRDLALVERNNRMEAKDSEKNPQRL